nr:src activatable repoter fBARwt [synthetic construct]
MEDAKNIKKGPAPFYPLEDGTAGEQLHKAMKRYALVPGTIAFTDAHIEVDITYAEYFEMSVRLAEAMKRYGLNTNHRIVVCSENSLQFFMPVLGALFIGVAVAPANDIYNERELLNSMGISQPTVVFVSKKGLQKILNVQKKLPIIQKIIIMDSKTDYQGFQSMYTFVTSHLPPGFNEYDFVPESFDRDKTIALIMNSSGSTGLPKGVALPHRTACVRFSHARDPIFGNQIIPDTAILSVVPFHHGFGMFTTLGYLICGFRVVLMYRFEEELFLRSLQDYKIQSALLVPTLFSFFAKSTLIDKYDLSNLHEIASGGAPLSKEVGEAVAKRFHLPGIRQGYGLTETTSAILITPEGDDKPGAVGKVVPFFEAKVVDLDTGKTLGVNQRGELCVRGPMIMSGYVNNPEATNALIDKDGGGRSSKKKGNGRFLTLKPLPDSIIQESLEIQQGVNPFFIGRSEDCNCKIEDNRLSRVHCFIFKKRHAVGKSMYESPAQGLDDIWYCHTGTNVSYLNNNRMIQGTKFLLQDGDEIKIIWDKNNKFVIGFKVEINDTTGLFNEGLGMLQEQRVVLKQTAEEKDLVKKLSRGGSGGQSRPRSCTWPDPRPEKKKGGSGGSGYVNNPEATNALIDKDGWLHSGDIAYWDEDEHFFIVDRLKSLIKYKGYQVAPAELESILLQHPNIFDAGVAGLPDDDAGELPAAVVVLEHGKTMTEKEIVDYVASQVTTAKKLRGGVVFVDEVPKGLTGKLDARKIREILIKAKKGGKIAV